MNRLTVLLVSGALWALMTFRLVEREIVPYLEYMEQPTYGTLLRGKLEPEVKIYDIYHMISNRIGTSEVMVRPGEKAGWVIESRMKMYTELMLKDWKIPVNHQAVSETVIDEAYKVSRMSMDGSTMGMKFSMNGIRRGTALDLAYDMGLLGKGSMMVDMDDESMIGDSFSPFLGGGRLWKGKHWKLQVLDTFSLVGMGGSKGGVNKKVVYAEVEGRAILRWQGQDVYCWVVHVRETPHSELPMYTLHVTDDGTVLSTRYYMGKGGDMSFEIRLRDKRRLSPEEARDWNWSVPSGKGR